MGNIVLRFLGIVFGSMVVIGLILGPGIGALVWAVVILFAIWDATVRVRALRSP